MYLFFNSLKHKQTGLKWLKSSYPGLNRLGERKEWLQERKEEKYIKERDISKGCVQVDV